MQNKAMIGTMLLWIGACGGVMTLLYSLVNDWRAALIFIICMLMAGAGYYMQKTFQTESWR